MKEHVLRQHQQLHCPNGGAPTMARYAKARSGIFLIKKNSCSSRALGMRSSRTALSSVILKLYGISADSTMDLMQSSYFARMWKDADLNVFSVMRHLQFFLRATREPIYAKKHCRNDDPRRKPYWKPPLPIIWMAPVL
jgi:hypothetical protein